MQRKDVHKRLEIYTDKTDTTCPFTNCKCKKINKSNHGICSFFFKGNYQILCPNIFIKSDFIEYINNVFLKADKYYLLKEVKYGNNYFDFILYNEINEEFVIIETQSLDSCGNYLSLLGEDVKSFTINRKTTLKTTIYQLIMKTYIAKKYKKKIVLVCQDSLLDYIEIEKLCSSSIDYSKDVFFLSYRYDGKTFINKKIYSLSFDDLLKLHKNIINFADDLDKVIKNKVKSVKNN